MTPFTARIFKLASPRAMSCVGIRPRPIFRGAGSERALSTGEKLGAAPLAQGAAVQDWYPNLSIARDLSKEIIQPKFWDGVNHQDPASYMIDCSGLDLSKSPDELPELKQQIIDLFAKTGCVLLTNNTCLDVEAVEKWARVPMREVMIYEGGANQRDSIEKSVYETGAPASAYLHYHHEMAYVGESIENIAFIAFEAISDPKDPVRGASFLSDQVKATELLLQTTVGQKLKEKGICYIRCLTDKTQMDSMSWKAMEREGKTAGAPIYNHWQDSFMTEDPAEAQRLAERKGLQVEWADGFMKTKFYVSGFEYCPATDKNILYSSVADDGAWFDTWPGMENLPNMSDYNGARPDTKPLKITYGDDTLFTREELAEFTHIYDVCGFPIGGPNGWRKGDIAISCNYRFAHGRPGYHLEAGEKRDLGVILGPMYKRLGCRPDKW